MFQYVTEPVHVQDKIRSNSSFDVHIGIGSRYMYKRHFNRTAFIKVRLAQSVEQQARNLKVVGANPTVEKNFSFCILSLSMRSWQVDRCNANEIKYIIANMSKVIRA